MLPPGWLTPIFSAPPIFLFSSSISKANAMLMMTAINSYGPNTVLCACHALSLLIQYTLSYVLLYSFLKWGNWDSKKRWITCPGSCIQTSGWGGLKSRTIYYKARFPDQSLRRSWVCLNSMVLPKLSTSSRNLSSLWLNPFSHVTLDFGWQPFYCWTRNIARKLSFDIQ